MSRTLLPAGAALVAALIVGLPGAFARPAAEPGITATEILLGGTASLTGPLSASAAVVRGAEAYFRWVNGRGGVHGRRIVYRYVDDASDAAQAAQATRHLVEENGVFALVNSTGTEQGLAARGYLNGVGVPQLFVASGASAFGRDYRRYPWTIGFGPSLHAEGRIYGAYLARTRPRARVAVLVQNDADERELLAGLRRGLGRSRAKVVGTQRFDPAAPELAAQVASLKASGADVLAVFAPARVAGQVFAAAARLVWRPLTLVASSATAAPGVPQGAVSLAYLKDPGDPRWAEDAGARLYRSILSRYAKGANARDLLHAHGMAVAYTVVRVLRVAGPEPTRASLLAAARSLRDASNPFLLPGIAVRTSRTDPFPLEQGVLQRRSGRSWRLFGGLWSVS
ncbi:MAG TPA: ABC transporter substrate-binding protein [Gaiellaceae bacterium]|nr:ABC transporter substrate-binding protein [Gaiellaceae bacterium]